MQLGMIGLGRMGANMTRRLMGADVECVVYDRGLASVAVLAEEGAVGAASVAELVSRLASPRAVWLMIPAGAVQAAIDELAPLLAPGDILIDGGNSHYKDDIIRAQHLAERGIRYLDVGVSGGVWGLERGYCQMVGGDGPAVAQLAPVFTALAPGADAAPRTPGREGESGSEEQGWMHCGAAGAGHYVKMVHNGIEYGLMAAYAEGFNLLRHAGAGRKGRAVDAETAPLSNPEAFQYDIDLAAVAELWRRGSVVGSWLLDLSAQALHGHADLADYSPRVADSGEGRWTALAAVESGTPIPVLSAALFARFNSRDEDDYANRLLTAMRHGFGGHGVK
ncbi:MAG: 6-phosphogluconate dehydrogenase (decarboxylating) [Hydrogenophilales bacterium CG_4_10_14_3_um_filter_58_23]|nr:MAG: 6-phosphogluconate dehydrogenase (decarboxylating) [Hydrogenophilales bacterium CG18_big_fil_WC_8_21_14_2_50_58_12]PIY01493.1 MAG: 6-phosphogluconate dehydrogenase (decarboxylating) [Hydrogenophilales bacterium CG_4_10_14_3_um_filter_58_23]